MRIARVFCLIAVTAVPFGGPIYAQTTLSGDHVVDGDLAVGTSVNKSKLVIYSETGSNAAPALQVYGDGGIALGGEVDGLGAVALGSGWASGDYSFSTGYGYAWGYGASSLSLAEANAIGSCAISGGYTQGDWSVAMSGASTQGSYSTAMSGGVAFGKSSVAMTLGVAATDFSIAMGIGVYAGSYSVVALGRYNMPEGTGNQWIDGDPLFVIGNGTGNPADQLAVRYRNAFLIRKNGDVEMTAKVKMPRQGDILMGEFGNPE